MSSLLDLFLTTFFYSANQQTNSELHSLTQGFDDRSRESLKRKKDYKT